MKILSINKHIVFLFRFGAEIKADYLMIKFIITFLFYLSFNMINCQEDSIQKEIQDYPDSKFELNSKARRMIIYKLNDNDYHKINRKN